MPSFDTPEAFSVTAYVYAGSIRVVAGDRLDTIVEVRPRDPEKDLDVRAADQTEIAHAGGVLTVTTPRAKSARTWRHRLDTMGPLHLKPSHGLSTVDRAEGAAEIISSTGTVRVGLFDGPAVLKKSNGVTTVGTTTNGYLRIAEVARCEVQLQTTNGSVEVGIRESTVAWLDISYNHGKVRNTLAASQAPEQTADTVKIRARTNWGNIDVLPRPARNDRAVLDGIALRIPTGVSRDAPRKGNRAGLSD
ncbi:hypothetical protein [Streptomyces sp. NPDC086519]|uniref:hypothetical protein n=1 Tax=Streptomyces sp. NPDC086519 TaxID=3154863 RepID=UPI00344AC94F